MMYFIAVAIYIFSNYPKFLKENETIATKSKELDNVNIVIGSNDSAKFEEDAFYLIYNMLIK